MSAKRRTSDIRTGRAQQPKAGKSAASAPPVSSARMAEVKSLGRYEGRGGPANVMIDSRGVAKLTDFGVARITEGESDEAEKTRVGAVIGTPSYMSPEQIQGQPIDKRSDIFSAGVLFYQLVTGRKPFDGSGW